MDMIEVTPVRSLVWVFFSCAFLLLILNWFRFINAWFCLRSILGALEKLPIRAAFNRLPREKSMPIWRWNNSESSFPAARQLVDRLRALALEDSAAITSSTREDLETGIRILSAVFDSEDGRQSKILKMRLQTPSSPLTQAQEVESDPAADGTVATGGSSTRRSATVASEGPGRKSLNVVSRQSIETLVDETKTAMTDAINELSSGLLRKYWERGSNGIRKDTGPVKLEDVKPEDVKYILAEDIVALPFYTYIRHVVIEMRNLLFFVVLAFCLLFAALHTYAFRADQAIDRSFLVLFLILGGGVVWVLAQMERDPLLSRLNDSNPGELGKGFYLNLVRFGIVPFLTVVSSQVSSVSNLLLRWVQPTLEAFR